MTRQRGGTTRRRDDDEADATFSAEDIGRLLRENRVERELDLLTVHDRLHCPITQIEALENGDLASLPNQAQALSTLRRYAAFLELDGDALALQMIDTWSVVPPQPAEATGSDWATSAVTNVVTAVGSGPDHLRAFTQTGQVPRVGGGSSGPPVGSAYGYAVSTGPPTGTFPVVPRQDLKQSRRTVNRARRRRRAPTWLKVATWITAGLAAVVVVGLGLLHWRSEWLVRSHILKMVQPGSGASTGGTASGATPKATVVQTAASGPSATFTVGAAGFDVVVATSGRCWIQVTSSTSATPLISGVQDPGKVLRFHSQGAMTVQVGSSSVIVGIAVGKKTLYYNEPKVVPFTYTFTSSTGG